ncbi:MAG: hypothetical protein ACRD3P_13400 [Terriglobales bacterium]
MTIVTSEAKAALYTLGSARLEVLPIPVVLPPDGGPFKHTSA